eukprot:c18341_g1_i1.p3 GENE.c18341_g1_i1~~c18341_g1_i1.p3  ORF type:complete len:110 (+),score=15.17 c18341_g1_i1:208-537(+)
MNARRLFESNTEKSLPVSRRGATRDWAELVYSALCVGGFDKEVHAIGKHEVKHQRGNCKACFQLKKTPKGLPIQRQTVFLCAICGWMCKQCWKFEHKVYVALSQYERRT